MARTRNTPALGLSGIWTLVSPWNADPGLIYKCTATRYFTEMVGEGIDIFKKYYAPKGLTEQDYKSDLNAGAVMCILYSTSGSVITVPDTFIQGYPGIGMSNWGEIILSASLGPIRLDLNLDFAKEQVANVLSDTIGMSPIVHVDMLNTVTAISPDEAAAIEAARVSAIKNRTSTYAKNLALQQENADLRRQIAALLATNSGA